MDAAVVVAIVGLVLTVIGLLFALFGGMWKFSAKQGSMETQLEVVVQQAAKWDSTARQIFQRLDDLPCGEERARLKALEDKAERNERRLDKVFNGQ